MTQPVNWICWSVCFMKDVIFLWVELNNTNNEYASYFMFLCGDIFNFNQFFANFPCKFWSSKSNHWMNPHGVYERCPILSECTLNDPILFWCELLQELKFFHPKFISYIELEIFYNSFTLECSLLWLMCMWSLQFFDQFAKMDLVFKS